MKFYGHADANELASVRSWHPRTGWSITRRWTGNPAALDTIQAQLLADGVPIDRDPGERGGFGRISGTFGADTDQPEDQPLSDNWSLVGNDLEKTLWELPQVVAETSKIPGDDTTKIQRLARLKADIDALVRGQTTTTGDTGEEIDLTVDQLMLVVAALGMSTTVFLGLMKSMAAGVESWSVSQFVLRNVRVLAKNFGSSLKPNYDNVGKVLTTATLKQQEQVPSVLPFDIPEGVWLKRTPTADYESADKTVVTREFWHADSYDKFVYGEAL